MVGDGAAASGRVTVSCFNGWRAAGPRDRGSGPVGSVWPSLAFMVGEGPRPVDLACPRTTDGWRRRSGGTGRDRGEAAPARRARVEGAGSSGPPHRKLRDGWRRDPPTGPLDSCPSASAGACEGGPRRGFFRGCCPACLGGQMVTFAAGRQSSDVSRNMCPFRRAILSCTSRAGRRRTGRRGVAVGSAVRPPGPTSADGVRRIIGCLERHPTASAAGSGGPRAASSAARCIRMTRGTSP